MDYRQAGKSIITILLLTSSVELQLHGQNNISCIVDVPVSVVAPSGALIQDLSNSSFIPKANAPVSILQAKYDTGPRRIVFVIDHDSQLNHAGAAIETAVLERILMNARESDSFGLTSSGDDAVNVALSDPQTTLSISRELLARHLPRSSYVGLVDAISNASALFRNRQLGDAVVLFSTTDELQSGKAHFHSLYSSLLRQRVRVFTVLMGPPFPGTILREFGSQPVLAAPETANYLTWGTGGYVLPENSHDSQREFIVSDANLKAVAAFGWQLYGAIAQVYDLQLQADPSSTRLPWTLDLSPEIRSKKRNALLVYPRTVPSCRDN